MERSKKVICQVDGANGKKFWMRVGNAHVNRDGSLNVYLQAYPANGGKLQIRDLDERDLARREDRAAPGEGLSSSSALGSPDELPLLRDSALPF
jgi:hypothetical protein